MSAAGTACKEFKGPWAAPQTVALSRSARAKQSFSEKAAGMPFRDRGSPSAAVEIEFVVTYAPGGNRVRQRGGSPQQLISAGGMTWLKFGAPLRN
jgi:hypothetical protein